MLTFIAFSSLLLPVWIQFAEKIIVNSHRLNFDFKYSIFFTNSHVRTHLIFIQTTLTQIIHNIRCHFLSLWALKHMKIIWKTPTRKTKGWTAFVLCWLVIHGYYERSLTNERTSYHITPTAIYSIDHHTAIHTTPIYIICYAFVYVCRQNPEATTTESVLLCAFHSSLAPLRFEKTASKRNIL